VSLPAYIGRRLLALIPILIGISILVFMLLHMIKGDPAITVLGNKATPARVAALHHEWGLDKPLPVQYGKFMGRVLHGDLGQSLFFDASVGGMVKDKLPVTLFLIVFGGVLSVVFAVPLAVLAALKRDRFADHAVRVVPIVGLGFPPFWLGIMLILLLSLNNGQLFPVGDYGTGGFTDHLHHMLLPSLTVALAITPILIRSLRAALLEVLEADYITTARSKGISERRVLWRHALRNAIISMVAVLAVNLAYLVGGTLIVEQVFDLHGVGQMMIDAINQRDFPVVQGVTLMFAVLVVLVYLVADIVQALLDPRVRFG
jgi:peptide/nickel transport system permease protein